LRGEPSALDVQGEKCLPTLDGEIFPINFEIGKYLLPPDGY